jgi:hypothetical protein
VIQSDNFRSSTDLAQLATRFRVKINLSRRPPMRTGAATLPG